MWFNILLVPTRYGYPKFCSEFIPFSYVLLGDIVKSPKQSLGDLLFLLRFLLLLLFLFLSSSSSSPFFLRTMNLSMADLRNYWTEFRETWWSYRYMFIVDPKVFRFVVKGVKAIFLGVQMGWGLL